MRENIRTGPRSASFSQHRRHPDDGGSPRGNQETPHQALKKHHIRPRRNPERSNKAGIAIPGTLGEALTALYNLSLNWSAALTSSRGQAFASS